MYFDVQMTVQRVKFLKLYKLHALISQICFWNKTTRFGQFLCPSSGVFHCTHSNGICHTGLLTACEQHQDGTGLDLTLLASCQQTCMAYTIAMCTVRTLDDGQRNCPKHVEFYSKIKFEKSVHLVGFIVGILNGFYSMKLLSVRIGVTKIIFGSCWDHYNPLFMYLR